MRLTGQNDRSSREIGHFFATSELRRSSPIMFANPHSNLHERYRQHRRQISTPNVLEAAKVPTLPPQALQRIQAHRRGQSLDQRSAHVQRPRSMQDGSIAINTNQTVPQRPQMVAGGAHHQQFSQSPRFPQQPTPMSMMPECQSFPFPLPVASQEMPRQTSNVIHLNMAYMAPDFVNIGNHCVGNRPMVSNLNLIQQQQLHNHHITANNALDGQILDNGAFNIYQHGLRPQNNNVSVDTRRLSVQSDVSPSHQPHTPKQTNSQYFPITPATTPFKKSAELAQYSTDVQTTPSKEQRFSAAEAAFMQRAKSLQGVAGTTFSQPKIEMLTPHNTGSFEIESFNTFGSQQGSTFEFSESENLSQDQYASSATSSFQSSPELAAMPSPKNHNEKVHKIPIFPAVSSRISHKKTLSLPASTSPVKAKLSPRVASIDNLNLDARVHASIKETGVTIDEIASYISGPHPEDGKWVCLHPGCERRFGRKENIKSHVQTHLGDRQYKCDHCNKCFVRGHDLKRHAKIHTGDKPYECLCGNVFARHDALTRHRQRGMCIGGYKGIVRKTTKRGRPKKHRPEMDERQDKAAKTRQRVADKTSFDSSSSADAAPNSPPSEVLENMSLHGGPSPKEEMPVFNQPDYSLPPSAFTFTPPASPGHNLGNRPSPNESYRSLTPNSEDEMLPLSPIKRSLERIVEESGLPYMENTELYTEITTSDADLSSPHTAPTLADSCHGSDLDIFISPDGSANFKHEFPELNDMTTFPDYANTSSFDTGMDLFSSKNFSSGPSMNDDLFSFQFQVDDQPLDVMTKDFFTE